MHRIELYAPVHKGLRAEAFELARELSRTDWGDDAQATAAAGRVARLVEFLEEHAQHEDTHLMPLVARAAPALARELESEHTRVDAALRGLAALAARIGGARNGGRAALGRELERCFQLALAEQLVHLQREEHEAEPALHAQLGADELVRAHERILADIPPPRLAQWFELILPALGDEECARMLAGLYASAPHDVFEALTTPARMRLGAQAWTSACVRAALPAERVRVERSPRN
ncbi:MAG: hemerythrin domain-containing protein [Planctomycetes bacterium]|nr:hemerythrin domain-containing protein [Planctomycetota bacterium]